MSHIYLNYNYKTYSYINSSEISGLMLAKIINRYNSYDLYGNNIIDKEEENINNYKDTDEISYNSRQTRNTKNLVPLKGDNSSNQPYIFMGRNNMNNACEENITNNSENSKEYTTENNILNYLNKNEIKNNKNNPQIPNDQNSNIS